LDKSRYYVDQFEPLVFVAALTLIVTVVVQRRYCNV
jgi:hypothetical protein